MTEKNLTTITTIATSLKHPDAFFYDLQVGDESVFGFFEGDETGVPFSVSFEDFLSSAYSLGVIASYDKREIWISDSYEGHPMKPLDYIQWAVEDREEGQAVLKHAIECAWGEYLRRLSEEIGRTCTGVSFVERFRKGEIDPEFRESVQELADALAALAKKEAA